MLGEMPILENAAFRRLAGLSFVIAAMKWAFETWVFWTGAIVHYAYEVR
jgi:hypothetical protein